VFSLTLRGPIVNRHLKRAQLEVERATLRLTLQRMDLIEDLKTAQLLPDNRDQQMRLPDLSLVETNNNFLDRLIQLTMECFPFIVPQSSKIY
jgi:hypothetical protein